MRSRVLGVGFDPETREINSLANLATRERISLNPQSSFRMALDDGEIASSECIVEREESNSVSRRVTYRTERFEVATTYALNPDQHFLEKRLVVRPLTEESYLIRRIDLGTFGVESPGYGLVPFQHGQCRTYFLRGRKSGFMFGVQVPVLDQEQSDTRNITLGYPVNYRFGPRETYEAEVLFWGTYRLEGRAAPSVPVRIKESVQSPVPPDLGESRAMLEMVNARLPKRREGIVVAVNGCQLKATLDPYDEDHSASVDEDERIFERAREYFGECIVQPHPTWAGAQVAASELGSKDSRLPEMPVCDAFLDWAASLGLSVGSYVPLKGPFPWNFEGRRLYTYAPDRPDWLAVNPGYTKHGYNCPVNRPFMAWLGRVITDDVRRHPQIAEFMEDEAPPAPRYTLRCESTQHDHLPGDVSYGYFLARRRLFEEVRKARPSIILNGERPQMDCGIWDSLYLDSLFTLSEMLENVGSDDIRTSSRIRHFYHFVPPSMDEVPIKHLERQNPDYAMLSVLAVSSNYLVCGLPENWPRERIAVVRRWVDWAREHAELMLQCVFLPDWPGSRNCDGYVRAKDNRGFAFFFNADNEESPATLPLNSSAGLDGALRYQVTPEFTTGPDGPFERPGFQGATDSVVLTLPPRSAVLLRVSPEPNCHGQACESPGNADPD